MMSAMRIIFAVFKFTVIVWQRWMLRVRISQKLSTEGSSNRQEVYFSFTSLCRNAAFRRPTVNVTWRTQV
jgi:hypothetical protein